MASKFQVIVTPAAQQDLEDIINYLTEQESYDRAVEVNHESLATIEQLEEMPCCNFRLSLSLDKV